MEDFSDLTEAHHTTRRLHDAAPQIGAALNGIEAIAELLAAATVDDDLEPSTDPSDLDSAMKARRRFALLGAVAALADYTKISMRGVIGKHGEDRMMWGSSYHLSDEYMSLEPDWRLKESAKA